MTPELVGLIQTIALEAIKILGPAAIAAYATYRATAIQFEIKLKELERTNEFSARDRIYTHLKERLTKVDQDSSKLNEEIGRMLGFVVGATGGDAPNPSMSEFIELMGAFAESIARKVPVEISGLLDDMRSAGLENSSEFSALKEYEGFAFNRQGQIAYAEIKKLLFLLVEIHNTMGLCMRRLISQKMGKAFSGYAKD